MDVRLGPKADIRAAKSHVRFTPKAVKGCSALVRYTCSRRPNGPAPQQPALELEINHAYTKLFVLCAAKLGPYGAICVRRGTSVDFTASSGSLFDHLVGAGK